MQITRKLTIKHYIIIGSMLFGMFFGAGNLIFPIHLGQLAGANWLTAGWGFLLTGTLLPLLGIIAISVTHSSGIYELARPIGKRYAFYGTDLCDFGTLVRDAADSHYAVSNWHR